MRWLAVRNRAYKKHEVGLRRLPTVRHEPAKAGFVPAHMDRTGESFTYQKGLIKSGGERGYADVWFRGHSTME